MNFDNPAISYALLIIPTFFALTVIMQGVSKISKQERDGQVALGFGVFLLVLIAVAYFLFIR